VLHDGHPTVCVADAAFAYVNAFKAHVNVGFFRGAELADPAGLLEGTGKVMRHVKLRPGIVFDATALAKLVHAAYIDMKERVESEALRARSSLSNEKQPNTNALHPTTAGRPLRSGCNRTPSRAGSPATAGFGR
jgi:hypothetical protein